MDPESTIKSEAHLCPNGGPIVGRFLNTFNFLFSLSRFSVSNDLKYDAERDLRDIGAKNIQVHSLNKVLKVFVWLLIVASIQIECETLFMFCFVPSLSMEKSHQNTMEVWKKVWSLLHTRPWLEKAKQVESIKQDSNSYSTGVEMILMVWYPFSDKGASSGFRKGEKNTALNGYHL